MPLINVCHSSLLVHKMDLSRPWPIRNHVPPPPPHPKFRISSLFLCVGVRKHRMTCNQWPLSRGSIRDLTGLLAEMLKFVRPLDVLTAENNTSWWRPNTRTHTHTHTRARARASWYTGIQFLVCRLKIFHCALSLIFADRNCCSCFLYHTLKAQWRNSLWNSSATCACNVSRPTQT